MVGQDDSNVDYVGQVAQLYMSVGLGLAVLINQFHHKDRYCFDSF